ncbi:2-oxoacid:acceptor oxidoreductase family protein [Clostridium polynesiense]|uniref:2-oxoacid:acceptor oxidoreductase family protein n=1 Tax=Clostridium polynesiense TaxID=1325933 RepID=UPI00058CB801|nr:2-oxoacid:acceptor oxidoreductase family protein [Clostridium polynesiense]
MSSQEILFAGFGGQGILSMAKFLAYAGMDAEKNVSWLPSYGPEMRGGTCNCSVIITEEQVGSPIVNKPDTLVVMNRPSLDKFENVIKPNGLVIIDEDMVDREAKREDIDVIRIPAQSIAQEIGSKTIANMVLLGALVAKTGIVSMEELLQALRDHGKEKYFEMNKIALEKGASYVK